jgi:hypothetical protein
MSEVFLQTASAQVHRSANGKVQAEWWTGGTFQIICKEVMHLLHSVPGLLSNSESILLLCNKMVHKVKGSKFVGENT